MRRRGEEHRLQPGIELAVHERHLQLVLEVTGRAKAAHYHGRAGLPGVFRQQSLEGGDFHSRLGPDDGAKQLQPFRQRKERLLGEVHGHRDHHAVGQTERAADQVLMTPRGRIERTRVDRDACHGAWQKVMAVSP